MNTTIAAPASAQGRAAISIIRISGPKSLSIISSITNKKHYKPNQIKPVWIMDGKERVDHSMVVYFKSPNSFTGQDMAEIHCHGSKVVQGRIIDLLIKKGAVPAKPGEFSERAYYNGKIDMAQAEAIMELVSAENVQLAKVATRQLAGEFSKKIDKINNQVIELSSAISADLDFSEEDTPSIDNKAIQLRLGSIIEQIDILQASSEMIVKLKNGVQVAILGLPNAGKSTLINRLLGYERAIVTEVAGTTRDTISESLSIDGVEYNFVDTAGLNEKPDEIEKIGIDKTIEAVRQSDIILLLIEPGNENPTYNFIVKTGLSKILNTNNTIKIYTKSDIHKDYKKKNEYVSISAKDNKGIERIIEEVKRLSANITQTDLNLLTQRQASIIERAYLRLVNLYDNISALTNDIVSSELELTIKDLNELTGKQASQQIIDSMFRSFCIGK